MRTIAFYFVGLCYGLTGFVVAAEAVEDNAAADRHAPTPVVTTSTGESAEVSKLCPGCMKIFNGKDFDGWEADPSTWSIVDGAMRGYKGSSRVAYTKKDYGSFRLIFTARMNPVNKDHLGVLFWGDRPADRSKPKVDNAGWLQFMPPHGAMWDYHPPKHRNLPHETLVKGGRDFTKWCTTELLCNIDKGHDAGGGRRRRNCPLHAPAPQRTQRPREADCAGPDRHVPTRRRGFGVQGHLRRGKSEGESVDHGEVVRQRFRLYTPHGVNQFVMALPLTKMAIEIARPIPGWKPSTPDVGEKPLEIPRGDFSALVIHFWASWNGVDPLMDDCVQQVADRFSSRVKFASADVDSERGTGLVQQFGVATVPSLLILKSDAKPRMIVGYRDPEKLAADIESRLLPPTSRPWWAIWRRDS